MLSSVLPPVDNFPIGQHRFIIRLLKGVFNSRPPTRKLVPEWDLNLVLTALQKCPFEPMMKTHMKFVTFKTVFLIAVTTFRRCSDINSLKLGENNVNVQNRGITFIRTGISKTDRPGHISPYIFIPAFPSNKLLDPKRALAIYLKRTELHRLVNGKDETKLFISFCRPYRPVTSQTIGAWIRKTVQRAYKESDKESGKVLPHSTRSLGASWALLKGTPLKNIMEAADWTRESTFIKFYLKSVNTEILQ